MSSSWDNSVLSEKKRGAVTGRGRKYDDERSVASYYTNEESMWSGSNSFDDTRETMNSYYSYDEETVGYRDDDPFFEVAAQCRAIPTRMPNIMRHFAEGASSLGLRVNEYAAELEKEGKPNSVVTAVGKVLTSATPTSRESPSRPSNRREGRQKEDLRAPELPRVTSDDTFNTAAEKEGHDAWGQSLSVKGEIAEKDQRPELERTNSEASAKSLTSFMSNMSSIFNDKNKRDENDQSKANSSSKRNDRKNKSGANDSPPDSPPKSSAPKPLFSKAPVGPNYSIDHFGTTLTNPLSEAMDTYDSFTGGKMRNFGVGTANTDMTSVISGFDFPSLKSVSSEETAGTATTAGTNASTLSFLPTVPTTATLEPETLKVLLETAIRSISSRKFTSVIEIITSNPMLVNMKSTKRGSKTLLHIAAAQKKPIPDSVILKMISIKSEAVGAVDDNGNIPLHYAASIAKHPATVRLLVECFRDGASKQNKDGNLPLHLAACYGKNGDESVRHLLDAYPKGITVANKKGRLPVHMACSKEKAAHATVASILHVHKSKREKASKLDTDGNSPLHLAIKSLSSYKVICSFQEASESFVRVFLQPDATGSLPIHIALNTLGVDSRVVASIIKAAPFTGAVPTAAGVMPIRLATMHKMPNDIVKALLVTDMPIDLGARKQLGMKPIINRQHGHSWWHITVECNDKYFQVVESVLSTMTNQPQIIALARTLGPDGKTRVIEAVSSSCSKLFSRLLQFCDRYELMTGKACYAENDVQIFHALDCNSKRFDDSDDGSKEEWNSNFTSKKRNKDGGDPQEVILRCFYFEETFQSEINVRDQYKLSSNHTESVLRTHCAEDYQKYAFSAGRLHCIAFECYDHTLSEVFDKTPIGKRSEKWVKKCAMVLKHVAYALKHLHQQGVIHGNLLPTSIAKYGNKWKLTDIGTLTPVGGAMRGPLRPCAPPETILALKAPSRPMLQTGGNAGKILPPALKNGAKLAQPAGILKGGQHNPATYSSPLPKGVKFDDKSTASTAVHDPKPTPKAQRGTHVGLKKSSVVIDKAKRKRAGIMMFGMQDMGISDHDAKETARSSAKTREMERTQKLILDEKEAEIERLRKIIEGQEREQKEQEEQRDKLRRGAEASLPPSLPTLRFAPERCIASAAWDVWSFGLIMGQLLLGRNVNLLPNSEKSEEGLLRNLYFYDKTAAKKIRESVRESAGEQAGDLISRLLHPAPEMRPSTMTKVLRHKYFHEADGGASKVGGSSKADDVSQKS